MLGYKFGVENSRGIEMSPTENPDTQSIVNSDPFFQYSRSHSAGKNLLAILKPMIKETCVKKSIEIFRLFFLSQNA